MNRYSVFFLLVFFIFSAITDDDSETTFIIEPHIGDNLVHVTQTYNLTQEGLTEFEILTVSLSYVDLHIFDERGNLDYRLGENIIIGRNIYRNLTVYFHKPTKDHYSFTVKYWFPTFATGKPITGKYTYNFVSLTDSTTVIFNIPLTGITETARASPPPTVEEKKDCTVFSYQFSRDSAIILPYEPKEAIDYEDTETKTFSSEGYTFDVTYPRRTEIFLEDIEFFISSAFPIFLEETDTPLRFDIIEIDLEKEEDTWAAAGYRGSGKIRILINNTASYPSKFLAHELTHSYIGDFPRYLEEGMANYFEGRVSTHFASPAPETYIPNRESFFQTYERQFGETVDITQSRYGLGLTDHQEALIYAKYNKGTHVIYEISHVCGHETVQEMLRILTEERDCELNRLISKLSKGDVVYEILKRYEFDVIPPYAYPAEELLREVRDESWWSYVLCYIAGFKSRIRTAALRDISDIKVDIEKMGEIASKTVRVADGASFVIVLFLVLITGKKVYRARKENPRVLYYFYWVPVVAALGVFSYLLYELLFSGYKFRWILKNIMTPFGLGISLGVILIIALESMLPKRYKEKFVVEVVWSLSFFGILVALVQVLILEGLMLALGYVISLVVLFVIRRRLK
jgi:hypothetical protein